MNGHRAMQAALHQWNLLVNPLKGIDTLEDLAWVKSVVVETVHRTGSQPVPETQLLPGWALKHFPAGDQSGCHTVSG